MRRTIALLLVLFLLGFGCLEERSVPSSKTEQISNTQAVDLDSDAIPDYTVYDYAPVAVAGTGLVVQRQVTVAAGTSGTFTAIDPNLTDVDLLFADQSLDEFSKSRIQADTACSQAIGLSNVVCSDVTTCAKLCSAASQKCRKIADGNSEALAGSMISYVQANNQLRSLILDSRRMVLNLRNASSEDQDAFLQKVRDMVTSVGDINANPLYTYGDFALCQHSDFGVPYLLEALDRIGNYSSTPTEYQYTVVLSVKPSAATGSEVAGVGVTDRMPLSAASPDGISSIQTVSTSQDALNTLVSWNSPKTSKEGYVFVYQFSSAESPDTALASIKAPDVTVRKVNLVALGPTDFIFGLLYGMTKNYYLSLGAALGITIAALLLLYNIGVLVFTMFSERAAGATLTTGFRKAFGRTDVRWKTDIVIGILFLGAGYYVSSVIAAQPATPPALLESIDFLLKSDMGLVGIGLSLIGVVMVYFAAENMAKITILERAYGMVIRQEKDMFLAKAASLKDRIKELETLIEEYSKDDFDVSKEYDTLTSLKGEKVDAISKEMTARTKAVIDENLSKAESALSSLKERRRLADENWPKWKENIAKGLEEQDEVYIASLVTVPASLRAWALGRYVKEAGGEGVVFERDSLKKKKVSAPELVSELIEHGVLRGAIILKQDKAVLSEFSEGSGTVMTALALKLSSYLRSLAKNLGQHPPTSFVAVGDKTVVVIMKGRLTDSVLFISKDRFKEAIEQWKAKMKLIEGG
jgi:hypothetical protein